MESGVNTIYITEHRLGLIYVAATKVTSIACVYCQ